MKRLKQLFKRFIHTHIVYHDPGPIIFVTDNDAHTFCSSVRQYFKNSKPGLVYTIAYDPAFDHPLDLLRQDGWCVQLQIDASGSLEYVISSNRSEKTSPDC